MSSPAATSRAARAAAAAVVRHSLPRPLLFRTSHPATKSTSSRPITTTTPLTRNSHLQQQQQRQQQHQPKPTRPPTRRSPTPRAPLQKRPYHSTSHPPSPSPFTEAEQTLLSAAYPHVTAHGFTSEALALGARDAGLLDISPSLLPDGPFSLIRWHLVTQREALASKAAALFATSTTPQDGNSSGVPGDLSVAEKVEILLWERLKGNEQVLNRLQEALAIMAHPSYLPASLKELALLADEIWYLAGDIAVDPTWYTKRASLSAIYAAAELFQTSDQSPGHAETRAFLRRRLDEAARAGGAVRSVGEWLAFTASAGVNVLRSKGVRI